MMEINDNFDNISKKDEVPVFPKGNYVAIEIDPVSTVSTSGLYLPPKPSDTGVVKAVSQDEELQVKVGQRVKFTGEGIIYKDLLLISEENILFIFE